ncbi:MAG: hypothetical protein K0R15_1416 [Clostridiales bacterium]|jgi:tRNA threonylcarbamoyladenosine biosynthesis protein TsaB|nr:hypothetical protein [Clostridiales bacterium]
MRILAIESSAIVASVAFVDSDQILGEFTTNHKKTHSQSLMPMLDELIKQLEVDIKSIDAIAISEGPGSFTGLRIGSATAKGLGLALNKPIISVPTLEAMANNFCYAKDLLICPIIDARRNQVYAGMYQSNGDKIVAIREDRSIEIDELLSELDKYGNQCIFLGDGVTIHFDKIKDKLADKALFAPVNLNRQNATAVARVALNYYNEGKLENARDHAPNYLRLVQAERELKEKMDVNN